MNKITRYTIKKNKCEASIYVDDVLNQFHRMFQRGRVFDLVFADPIFNIGRRYADGIKDRMSKIDYDMFTKRWVSAACDCVDDHGTLAINVYDNACAQVVLTAELEGFELSNWIIWHYRFGQNRDDSYINSKQHCLIFQRDKLHCNPTTEPSDRLTKYGDKRIHERKSGKVGWRSCFDVWQGEGFSRVTGNNKERWKSPEFPRGHDNQLPERYLRRIVCSYTKPGDSILEGFAGTGGLGAVSLQMGRNYTGIELSPSAARSAARRINRGAVTSEDWR